MIPMSPDVRPLIGEYAEFVDNRSLLYEKFSVPKGWGHPDKTDQAALWSVIRICLRGDQLLKDEARRYKADSDKRRRRSNEEVNPKKHDDLLKRAEESERLSKLAASLARISSISPDLIKCANDNARRMLADVNRSFHEQVVTFEATLGGRLLVNMAGGVIENAGICLDRCFGLPFIPGSAVKGIARSQALWEIKEASSADRPIFLKLAMTVFGFGKPDIATDGAWTWAAGVQQARDTAAALGSNEFKGCACFLPAFPTTAPTLVVDMVNPHYPEYYRGKRERADDDENPIPNYFPTVEAGAAFGFAVLLNRTPGGFDGAELLGAARGWVERALTEKGAGAKTAAGYGWFKLGAPEATTQSVPDQPQVTAPAKRPVSSIVNEATLKNYITALMNPGTREGILSSIKAGLERDVTFAARLASALAKQGKPGKKVIEWLKTRGVNLT